MGDAKGTSGSHGGIIQPHGDGKGPRAGGEGIPRLTPIHDIAMLKKPVLNSRVEHDKAVIKCISVAVGVGRPGSKQGGELRVG